MKTAFRVSWVFICVLWCGKTQAQRYEIKLLPSNTTSLWLSYSYSWIHGLARRYSTGTRALSRDVAHLDTPPRGTCRSRRRAQDTISVITDVQLLRVSQNLRSHFFDLFRGSLFGRCGLDGWVSRRMESERSDLVLMEEAWVTLHLRDQSQYGTAVCLRTLIHSGRFRKTEVLGDSVKLGKMFVLLNY